ncbi:hypothetical protein J5N97_016694 [Dioscorea zingiberensis]|uniref:Phytocyanin domain-containing protein n=1 Tax=Dioscorea zingiberensis TaxID=325984 RepID=A0A9D5CKQ3_9LILI|nr:hypothetical protein J5N97_016694 [Dioscorea zingiberensis]
MGWTVPTDPNAMTYNQWAQSNRFQVGDSLLFVYPPETDQVLQVNEESYNSCNTRSYIKSYKDGNTVILLDRSGPFYFISGIQANCLKNESMVVVVISERTSSYNQSPPASNAAPSSSSSSTFWVVSALMAKLGPLLAPLLRRLKRIGGRNECKGCKQSRQVLTDIDYSELMDLLGLWPHATLAPKEQGSLQQHAATSSKKGELQKTTFLSSRERLQKAGPFGYPT